MKVKITHRPLRARLGAALPWLPLAALLALLAISTLGRPPVPAALGDAAGDLVNVTGNVANEVHLDAGTCVGAALALGTLVPDDPAAQGAACTVTFGSSSAAGADLNVNEDPVAPAAGNAMKCTSGGCGVDSVPDYQGLDPNSAPGGEAFAVEMDAASAPATSVWNLGQYYDVQDAADLACQTVGIADGSCGFRFTARVSSANTSPGNYQALVEFTVVPR